MTTPPEWEWGSARVSFRLVSVYDAATDQPITRFDVWFAPKEGGKRGDQFNVGLFSSAPGSCGLNLPPAHGVLGAYGLEFHPPHLSQALRALANAIDEHG